jgi:hypothetical protein
MTRAFVLPIWCLALLFLPTGLTSGQKANSDSGRSERVFIQGPGFAGVIFPADMKAFEGHFPKGTRYWMPLKSDVIAAEHELLPYLRDSKNPQVREILAKIATYKRQYIGIELAGHKQIYMNFFCDADTSDTWKNGQVEVMDGGSCYFNLRFTPDSKNFSRLEINGRA